MAQQFAKDQPAGFTNHIERVAIVGAGGHVGTHVTKELLKTGKHTVTAITREGSKSKLPEGVQVATIDYDKPETIVAALKGQQFLLISLSVMAAPDTQKKLIDAAAEAGVPWVLPNSYCSDLTNESLSNEYLHGPTVKAGLKMAEDAGLSWVALCCSFWYEWSMALGDRMYGFDFPNKTVTFFDDGNTKINTTTWDQCGRAIAAFLSLKQLPDDADDKSPTMSQWRNKLLYTASFLASQRDMLDSVNRVMGLTDADWTIKSEPSAERYANAMEMLKEGKQVGFVTGMYTRVFFPNGGGDFESTHGLANDALGLPKENIDDATKRVVEMVNAEFNPFGH